MLSTAICYSHNILNTLSTQFLNFLNSNTLLKLIKYRYFRITRMASQIGPYNVRVWSQYTMEIIIDEGTDTMNIYWIKMFMKAKLIDNR